VVKATQSNDFLGFTFSDDNFPPVCNANIVATLFLAFQHFPYRSSNPPGNVFILFLAHLSVNQFFSLHIRQSRVETFKPAVAA
jgi:hypothetical protein